MLKCFSLVSQITVAVTLGFVKHWIAYTRWAITRKCIGLNITNLKGGSILIYTIY